MSMQSGLNTNTIEVLEDIQVNMSLDEAYALHSILPYFDTVVTRKLLKVIEAALVKYEDEIRQPEVCEAA